MAIEMPNAFEAAGTFDGFDPSTNANPIFSSNGVQPFDPATSSSNITGGFTRITTADYVIQLVRPIDVLESISMVSCFPGIKPVPLCISVVPGVDDSFDGTVLRAPGGQVVDHRRNHPGRRVSGGDVQHIRGGTDRRNAAKSTRETTRA